ncbi:hypothetical protein GCM10027068_14540 [Prescottella soli]
MSESRKAGPHTAEPNGDGALGALDVFDTGCDVEGDDGDSVGAVSVPVPDEHPTASPAHNATANACRIRIYPTVVDIRSSHFPSRAVQVMAR